MRDLLPTQRIIREICSHLELSSDIKSSIWKTEVHEDNQGARKLAILEPGRMTPRSKHYGQKYHWFRQQVADPSNKIQISYIDTKEQRADMLTKSLRVKEFEINRRLTSGW